MKRKLSLLVLAFGIIGFVSAALILWETDYGEDSAHTVSNFYRAVTAYDLQSARAAQHWNSFVAGRPLDRLSQDARLEFQRLVLDADGVRFPSPPKTSHASQLYAAIGRFHQALVLQEVGLENNDEAAIDAAQDAKQQAGLEISALRLIVCTNRSLGT